MEEMNIFKSVSEVRFRNTLPKMDCNRPNVDSLLKIQHKFEALLNS
jgi:hypothetical protein